MKQVCLEKTGWRKFTLTIGMVGLLSGAAVLSAEEPSAPYSFTQAIAEALERNPRVRTAQANLASAMERYPQSRAALLPDLSLSASYTRDRVEWERLKYATTADPSRIGLNLSQPLFNWKALVAYRQTEPYVGAADRDLESVRQSVVQQVAEVTIMLLQAEEVFRLSEENLKLATRSLDATAARFKVGEITRTDVSKAESAQAAALSKQISAENDVRVARSRYFEIVGVVAPPRLEVPKTSSKLADLPLEELLQAVEDRPDVESARLRLKVADINIEMEQAGHLPVVTLNATGAHQWRALDGLSKPSGQQQLTAMVGLSLPLYSGGMTTSRVDQARLDRDARSADLDRLRQQSAREVEQARLECQSAIASTRAMESAVKAAESAMLGIEQEYQVGTRTALDLLQSQTDLFTVSTDLAKSRFGLYLAQFHLLAATGRMTPRDVGEQLER